MQSRPCTIPYKAPIVLCFAKSAVPDFWYFDMPQYQRTVRNPVNFHQNKFNPSCLSSLIPFNNDFFTYFTNSHLHNQEIMENNPNTPILSTTRLVLKCQS